MRKAYAAIATAVISVAAFWGATGVATAANATACVEIEGGRGCWYDYGDIFRVTDTKSDGYHPEVSWQTFGRNGTCKNYNGAGTTVACDYDLAEHQPLVFYVKIWDGNAQIRYSGPIHTCTSKPGGICS
ncbi:hypothetical protein [Streptomyces sp. NPDC086838]|uniref:hypothetical protein n=1 Tax=Streptomyces sp. NPDC086838 TaxID=3365762 RepID=UPI0038189C36